MTVAYITHPDCALHRTGDGHPEAPDRLAAIEDRLLAAGLAGLLDYHEAPLADDQALLTVHSPAYLANLVRLTSEGDGLRALDATGDTVIGRGSLQAARRAAGAALLGVDLILTGRLQRAFCSVRPPGHHADREAASGFCLFNNVALAARRALDRYGLERVAVVDFDVHHGNGTEAVLEGDSRILFCSLFQEQLYPYVEAGDGCSRIGYPPLTAGRTFRARFEQACEPELDRFQPQLLILSAGFDGHHEDAISQTLLREADYGWITTRLLAVADRWASGRVLSCLEGGYDLSALGRCVSTHINALLGHAD